MAQPPRSRSVGKRTPAGARLALGFVTLAASGCFLFGGETTRTPDARPSAELAAPAPPPLASGRLPETARPLRQAVALEIDPSKDRFSGTTVITVDVPRALQAVVMHGRDLLVGGVEARVAGKRIAGEASFRAAGGGREDADELVLAFAEPLPKGTAEISIAWSAQVGDRLSGLFRVKEDDAWYAFTELEPAEARRVMPCFDEPGFKIPFEISVTAPKGNLVLANTPEIGRSASDDGGTIYRFAPTPPLPTYLFALAVGPFELRDAQKAPVPLRLVAPRGRAALGELALEAASAHVELLASYFDRPFPYPKLDLVAVPELGFGAMENAGLISFREDLVLLDPKTAGAEARHAMASTVAHEIAHHWFGNLVTMKWWDDLWLNEGFATWIEGKILDTWRPATGARLDAIRAKAAVMELDSLDSARAVRQRVSGSADAEDAFDDVTYDKGAAVLGMLEAWLGAETFRDGVRRYIKAHEHGSAAAADLFDALGKASGQDVGRVAATFLDQPGVPLLRAELSCKAGEPAKVKLSAEPYRARKTAKAERAYRFPACASFEGGDRDKPACGLVGDEAKGPAEITLPLAPGRCPKWVYPNADERGYFHFALPQAAYRDLASRVKALPAAERIGMLANTWALVQSGDVEADVLFDVLEKLRGERDRRVVDQMSAVLAHVARTLVDDQSRPAFRAFVGKVLGPTAKELGVLPRKGEADDRRLLRVRVLSTLADLADDPWVLAEAEKRATAWLADRRAIPADVTPVLLRASARKADEKRFRELVEAAKRAKAPEERRAAAGALGGFADPALLRRALDLVLTEPLKLQDGFWIWSAASARPEARPVVLGWVRERFGELRGKMPDFALTRLAGVVETICTPSALEDASRFFGPALKDTQGGERALVHALEKSELCIDLRARQAEKAGKRLGKR